MIRAKMEERFTGLDYNDYALIIMPVFFLDIVRQIDNNIVFDGITSYVYAFMMNMERRKDFSLKTAERMMIPKRIHYCWFGGKELPDIYRKNIDNWRQYCPDYEIIKLSVYA